MKMNSFCVATFCVFLAIVSSSNVPGQDVGNATSASTTKSTTSTIKPTTTTVHLNTTTAATTTAAPITNATTTVAPPTNATTTAAPSPTSVVPTFPPQPKTPAVDLYYFNNSVDICVLLETGLQFSFQFLNTSNKNETGIVDLPTANLTRISEICGDATPTTQSLKIEFFHNMSKPWALDMEFMLINNKMVMLSSMKLQYSLTKFIFPSLKKSVSGMGEIKNLTDLYNSRLGTCAQCISDSEFPVNHSDNVFKKFVTNGFRIQAFRNSTNAEFSEVNQYCPGDTTINNMVPIIVGAALGALVLIVLIAYIIGRKRSQRGYESV